MPTKRLLEPVAPPNLDRDHPRSCRVGPPEEPQNRGPPLLVGVDQDCFGCAPKGRVALVRTEYPAISFDKIAGHLVVVAAVAAAANSAAAAAASSAASHNNSALVEETNSAVVDVVDETGGPGACM